MTGNRKFFLGVVYLIGCFVVSTVAVWKGVVGWDAVGLAALFASIAPGLHSVMWANVHEHRAKSGNAPAVHSE